MSFRLLHILKGCAIIQIGDIMIYEKFKSSKELLKKTRFVKIYKCVCDDTEYEIIITRRFAGSHTVIHLREDLILWEHVPRAPLLFGKLMDERIPIYKFVRKKGVVRIFVVKGRRGPVVGLGDGIFRTYKKIDDNGIAVMMYSQFRKM